MHVLVSESYRPTSATALLKSGKGVHVDLPITDYAATNKTLRHSQCLRSNEFESKFNTKTDFTQQSHVFQNHEKMASERTGRQGGHKYPQNYPFGETGHVSSRDRSEFFRHLMEFDSSPFPVDTQGRILEFAAPIEIILEQHNEEESRELNRKHRLVRFSGSSLSERVLEENQLECYVHRKMNLEKGHVYVNWRRAWVPNDLLRSKMVAGRVVMGKQITDVDADLPATLNTKLEKGVPH